MLNSQKYKASLYLAALFVVIAPGQAQNSNSPQELLNLRQRMQENPGAYSWEDRMQLKGEFHANGMSSGASNEESSQKNISLIRKRMENTEKSRKMYSLVKGGTQLGIYSLGITMSVVTAGTMTHVAAVTVDALSLTMDKIFAKGEEQIENDFQKAISHHLSQMPRGHLPTTKESEDYLKQTFGADVLLDKLPPDIREAAAKDPTFAATLKKEQDARIKNFIIKNHADITRLASQQEHVKIDLEVLKLRMATTTNYLLELASDAQSRLNNLEFSQREMAGLIQTLNSEVTKHGVQLDKNTKDIDYLKNWMGGKMSAAELVQAAKSGVLNISGDKLQEIKFIAKVDRFQESANQVLGIAGQSLVLAHKLGVDPDLVSGISDVVKYSKAAIEIGSSIFRMDIIGSLSAIGGLFGGPDTNTLRHAEIMKALQGIQETQMKILENQQKISEQVSKLHEDLLSTRQELLRTLHREFNRVHVNDDSIRTLVSEVVKEANLGSCSVVSARYAQLNPPGSTLSKERALNELVQDPTMVAEAKRCRDGFFKLFFESEGLKQAKALSEIHPYFVHAAATGSRRVEQVDAAWNDDNDFYVLLDILQSFEQLSDKLGTVGQAFTALQSDTPKVNDVVARRMLLPLMKDNLPSAHLFPTRIQPDILLEVARRFRASLPLLNRISTQGFIPLEEIDVGNRHYSSTKENNLRLAKSILEYLKVAEAQERLKGGSFFIAQLSDFLLDPDSYINISQARGRLNVAKRVAAQLGDLFEHNPYLVQNYALYRISQNFDRELGIDRESQVANNELQVRAGNEVLTNMYREAFESGDLNALRRLLPRDWRVLCEGDENADLKSEWSSTYNTKEKCDLPKEEPREYSYRVRLKGFASMNPGAKDRNLEVIFSLPRPEALRGEFLLKSPNLIRIEEERALVEKILMENKPLHFIDNPSLKALDQALFGENNLGDLQ